MEENAPIDPRYRALRFWKHRIVRPLTDAYYVFRGSKPIMDFLMRGERERHTEHPPKLSPKEQAIAETLDRDGIVITSLSELGLPEYLERIRNFISSRKTASLGLKKQFLEYLWGERVDPFDQENPFNKLSLEPKIISLLSTYLGHQPLLYFTSANRTLPSTTAPRGSQNWHSDPAWGDERIVKMFLYVTDVAPENGPFEYVKRTCLSAQEPVISMRRSFRGTYPDGMALTPEILEKYLVSARGPAGTVVFCDTSGVHRGGYGPAGGRIMATAAYTSRFSLQGTRFKNTESYKKTYPLK